MDMMIYWDGPTILGNGRVQRCDHAKRIQELIAKGSDPKAHPAMRVSHDDWKWIVDFIRSDTYQRIIDLKIDGKHVAEITKYALHWRCTKERLNKGSHE
ncbi:hypothetical protein QJS10_CPA16g00873 [Acorus calamus]|uniref:Uncharacterized protein n=1 Tax=Acorus calamus TaxID=4465 RepID=A0AAV9D1U7_ACOCL|nr:hypothetical protein QJS10_CPA16g00873 [Acorus calamus]